MFCRRQGGDDPIEDVEQHVGSCEAGLEDDAGVGETDDPAHEEEGAAEGEEAVDRTAADGVDAFFAGVEVEVAGCAFVAFDDYEGALGVFDYDIAGGRVGIRIGSIGGRTPFVGPSGQRAEGGEEYSGHQRHAIFVVEAQAK